MGAAEADKVDLMIFTRDLTQQVAEIRDKDTSIFISLGSHQKTNIHRLSNIVREMTTLNKGEGSREVEMTKDRMMVRVAMRKATLPEVSRAAGELIVDSQQTIGAVIRTKLIVLAVEGLKEEVDKTFKITSSKGHKTIIMKANKRN